MTQSTKYFKDSSLNAEFLDNGYVILKIFTQKELSKLKLLYKELSSKNQKRYNDSIYVFPNLSSTVDIELKIKAEFEAIFKEKFEHLFVNYEYLSSVFIHKKKKNRFYELA